MCRDIPGNTTCPFPAGTRSAPWEHPARGVPSGCPLGGTELCVQLLWLDACRSQHISGFAPVGHVFTEQSPSAGWLVTRCWGSWSLGRGLRGVSCTAGLIPETRRKRRVLRGGGGTAQSPEVGDGTARCEQRAGAEMLLRTFLLQLLIPSSCLCWKWLLQSVGGERTEKGPI